MEPIRLRGRIWEIDVLRGLCIPGMILIHLIYDVVDLYGFVNWPYPAWYSLLKNNYGMLFVLLSGISVTLGRRCVRRGVTVLLWGMVITAVTLGMYRIGMAGRGVIVYFGVLHCLGMCMILWYWLRKLPNWALAGLAAGLIAAGWWLRTQCFDSVAFVMLGLQFPGFMTADYFPLMPNLGYFLAGSVVGRTLYREKKSLLPGCDARSTVLRGLGTMGRHSLCIYLVHQPILALMCQVVFILRKLG